mgnify:CR=1 FL=1
MTLDDLLSRDLQDYILQTTSSEPPLLSALRAETLPNLTRVGAYASPNSLTTKSIAELAELNAKVENAAGVVMQQQSWLDSSGEGLKKIATRACGSGLTLDSGVEPLGAAAQAEACMNGSNASQQIGDAAAVVGDADQLELCVMHQFGPHFAGGRGMLGQPRLHRCLLLGRGRRRDV